MSEDILKKLKSLVDTDHNCGYVTLIKLKKSKQDQQVLKPDKQVSEPVKQASDEKNPIKKEGASSGQEPKNGKMIPENANLVNFILV